MIFPTLTITGTPSIFPENTDFFTDGAKNDKLKNHRKFHILVYTPLTLLSDLQLFNFHLTVNQMIKTIKTKIT